MRTLVSLILICLLSSSVFAKEKESHSKTFLILFKAKELKSLNTSLTAIESQFSSFETKSYSGNSDLALLIEIPFCEFDECFLGNFPVELEKGKNLLLQEIAFRLFDITENRRNLDMLLSAYEENHERRKDTKGE